MSFATTIDNGASSNRIDIVILGDGYRATEFGAFDDHAKAMTDYLFVNGGVLSDPFSRYKNFFNVHQIYTASTQSGTDDPVNGITRDTAFDTTYRFDGVTDRLLSGSVAKADAAVDAELGGTGIAPEMLLMSVNSGKYGGAGGKYATYAGGNADALEVALHEIGHSFAHLADEYWYDNSTVYSGGEPSEANVTKDSGGAKWSHWLGYNQPGIGEIGAYEGGKYSGRDIYRPSENSKMRNLDKPFDVVSVEQFILKFYDFVDPLDSWTSNAGTLTGRKFIKVTPIDKAVIDVEWSVDGVAAPVGDVTKLNLTKLSLAPGTLVDVSARAYDPTDWVRIELDKLEMTVSWSARVPYYVNKVAGSTGRDLLDGVDWNDRMIGKAGNDRLRGFDGKDTLLGGDGRDRLLGGRGNDDLSGGKGKDVLTGGAGADAFDFTGPGRKGADRITDFQDGIDKIALGKGYAFADLTVNNVAEGARIAWDLGTVVLVGVDAADISGADFLF